MAVIKTRHGHPITADIIKATVSMTYRDKQYLTCTEFRFSHWEGHLKDVFAVKTNEMIEFEIKISKSDLLGDGKKKKHQKSPTVNKFYYVVPQNLVDDAISLCEKLNPLYGVICFEYPYKGNLMQGLHVAKNAKMLMPKKPVSEHVMEKLYRRLSYENGRLLMKLAKAEILANEIIEGLDI